ncbi:hypothetical protein XELAEV_18006701mg [Xenopus laevis]|uniref:Uncharacterized protein n=1 Tax=Xenopus laevis TaxID=8355 RepID=A0A974I4F3_XENLA|nr:hypothetical protein XELAEV_18006701mg [Xenopus laevis]
MPRDFASHGNAAVSERLEAAFLACPALLKGLLQNVYGGVRLFGFTDKECLAVKGSALPDMKQVHSINNK